MQDFYSHSNWVELHQHLAPIPVWDVNVASLPAGVLSGTYPSSHRRSKERADACRAEQGLPVCLVLAIGCPGRGRRTKPGKDASLSWATKPH